MWRSGLFVPATEPRFLEKAAKRGAQAIVLDLEASVVPDRKAEARAAIAPAVEFLQGSGLDILVRINMGWRTPFLDIEAVAIEGVTALLVPDVRDDTILRAIDGYLSELEAERGRTAPPIFVVPLIESAEGVENANLICAAPRVRAIALGVEDFVADMGALLDRDLLDHTARRLVSAARAHDMASLVVPESLANLSDMDRFEAAVLRARAYGSEGGFAVHPRQVEVLNRGFAPSQEEISMARRIVEAAAQAESEGVGAFQLDGRMIDLPIVVRAERLLNRAEGPTA
ncbi:CoA ester lyase [Mameliella alba]|nr:CoA ester lyase [Mameliella alba]